MIWFEIHGIPALAVASSEFQEAAATQAVALGLTEARRLFVEHPIQDATTAEMEKKADRLLKPLLEFMCGSSPPGAQ